ncbi:MAG: hypothetical protein NUV82_01525 [Candidatus Komeilibacteria bacterium]|nr:hypothetical protein [Candidatus Komeilibacteria bacterium]
MMNLIWQYNESGCHWLVGQESLVAEKREIWQRGRLLPQLEAWRQIVKFNWSQIEKIVIVTAVAPFSVTRSVFAVANTLAWSNRIPIYKVKGPLNRSQVLNLFRQLSTASAEMGFVVPEYNSLPNITMPGKKKQ